MKNIFTYPNNSSTHYVDPRYYGDDNTGWKKRIDDLLAGNYFDRGAVNPPMPSGSTSAFLSKYINYYDNVGDNNVGLWDFNHHIGLEVVLDSAATPITSIVTQPSGDHLLTTFRDHGITTSSGEIRLKVTATPSSPSNMPQVTLFNGNVYQANEFTYPNPNEILIPHEFTDPLTTGINIMSSTADFRILEEYDDTVTHTSGRSRYNIKMWTRTNDNTEFNINTSLGFYHYGLFQRFYDLNAGHSGVNPHFDNDYFVNTSTNYGSYVYTTYNYTDSSTFTNTGPTNQYYLEEDTTFSGEGRMYDVYVNSAKTEKAYVIYENYSQGYTSVPDDLWGIRFQDETSYDNRGTTGAIAWISGSSSITGLGGTTIRSSDSFGDVYGVFEHTGYSFGDPYDTGDIVKNPYIRVTEGTNKLRTWFNNLLQSDATWKQDSDWNNNSYKDGWCKVRYYDGNVVFSSSDPDFPDTVTQDSGIVIKKNKRVMINSSQTPTYRYFGKPPYQDYVEEDWVYYRIYIAGVASDGDHYYDIYLLDSSTVTRPPSGSNYLNYFGNRPYNVLKLPHECLLQIDIPQEPDFTPFTWSNLPVEFDSTSNIQYGTTEETYTTDDHSFIVDNDDWYTQGNRPYWVERGNSQVYFYGSKQFDYVDSDGVTQSGAILDDNVWLPGDTTTSDREFILTQSPTVTVGFDSNHRCNSISVSGGRSTATERVRYLQPFSTTPDETPNALTNLELAAAEDDFGITSPWISDISGIGDKYWPTTVKPMEATISQTTPTVNAVSKSGVKFSKVSGFTRTILSVNYPPMTQEEFKTYQSKFLLAQGSAAKFKFNIQLLDDFTLGFTKHTDLNNLSNTTPRVLSIIDDNGGILIGGFNSNETSVVEEGQLVSVDGAKNGGTQIALADCDANVFGEAMLTTVYNDFKDHNIGDIVNYDDDYLIVSLSADSFDYQQTTSGHILLSVDFELDYWR